MESLYFPVDVETLQLGFQQPFDVYFKTNEGKMTLYYTGGEIIKEEVFDNIQDNNITEKNCQILTKPAKQYIL